MAVAVVTRWAWVAWAGWEVAWPAETRNRCLIRWSRYELHFPNPGTGGDWKDGLGKALEQAVSTFRWTAASSA